MYRYSYVSEIFVGYAYVRHAVQANLKAIRVSNTRGTAFKSEWQSDNKVKVSHRETKILVDLRLGNWSVLIFTSPIRVHSPDSSDIPCFSHGA
jgi:hypothetical protein